MMHPEEEREGTNIERHYNQYDGGCCSNVVEQKETSFHTM